MNCNNVESEITRRIHLITAWVMLVEEEQPYIRNNDVYLVPRRYSVHVFRAPVLTSYFQFYVLHSYPITVLLMCISITTVVCASVFIPTYYVLKGEIMVNDLRLIILAVRTNGHWELEETAARISCECLKKQ